MGALVIGTRGSKLALCQARWVAGRLEAVGIESSIRVIRTTGDRQADLPLAAMGRQQGLKGLFTKEIEDALIDASVDLAVHSLKDLPTELDPRLELGCVPVRADPRDALVGRACDQLAAGDRVGTGSPRRAAQLAQLFPGTRVLDIRGNVDTRIRKLRSGEFDAIVLAAAGLARMGLDSEVSDYLDADRMVPAIGQGALGIEVRAGDRSVLAAIKPLHDQAAAAEVRAERSLLRALGGGCDLPLGGHAEFDGGWLRLVAAATRQGGGMARAEGSAPEGDANELGIRVAAALRRNGADLEA